MRRTPRYLAALLIFALLNISYINLALASSTQPSTVIPAPALPVDALPSVPDGPSHATKKDIEDDLDGTKTDYQTLIGTDPNSFSVQFINETGLDPLGDIDDAKSHVDSLTDDDIKNQQEKFDKLHTKLKKHNKNLVAILSNKPLMALLHSPSPLKFRAVVHSTAAVTPGSDKVSFVSIPTKDMNRSFPSLKSAAQRGAFTKGLAGLSVTLMPELGDDCKPGVGIPGGIRDLYISKGVSLAAEIVKEGIPDDDTDIVPHLIGVGIWGAAKTAELILEGLHAVYLECNAKKDGDDLADKVKTINDSISTGGAIYTTVTGINTTVTGLKTSVGDINTTVGGINTTVNNINTTVNGINSHTDIVKDTIILKIGDSATQVATNVNGNTSSVINASTTTITDAITNSTTSINNNDNSNKSAIISNDNTNATNIVNNANSNTTILTTLSLRLLIEGDLQQPDNATPMAIFETPTSKGGYLELVRSIVAETYQHLTTLSAAQINAALASGDSYKAAGNYKAAYAAYKKAYKTAAN